MGKCACCGNEYDKSFQVTSQGKTMVFDSFECAIHLLAPRCGHCAMAIIGHGVEAGGAIYCCAHCAAEMGHPELVDRA